MGRPHVFIIGAGASLAAMQHGDKHGKRLPLMFDLVDTIGLEELLRLAGINHKGRNFEEIYSELYDETRGPTSEIERVIRKYFEALKLPDFPTVYDHLVLSLRKKDVIATFNWDPFLWQACVRNHKHAELPNILFLHGNVAVGYCLECKKKSHPGEICNSCGKRLETPDLLYPIKKKDYHTNPYIAAEWEMLRHYLQHAYILTVFGYGAPTSDVEAIRIMKEAWGDPQQRNLEETEIIDIKGEDDLLATWAPFICEHHYQVHKNCYDSWAAKHPRRSCEAMWNQLMEVQFLDSNPIPRDLPFEDLINWFRPLIEAERNSQKK